MRRFTTLRTTRFAVQVLVLVFCSISLGACTSIQPCGTFAFTGNADDGATSNGITMNLSFDFDPAACGETCTTNTVAYIQMVRTYDLEDGTYSYISEEHEARAIAYGWYIDRLAGRIWGYYGRNNNGTWSNNLTPGNNATNAVLFDAPNRPNSVRNIWWQAVSAPVSIDGGADSCNNNFLGYYYWSWSVDDAGHLTDDDIINVTAWENLHLVMDDAVAAWNAQAPGIDHNEFPAFAKLMY
jgi:hypothetical protein